MYTIFGLLFFSPVFWYISQDWQNENILFGNITIAKFEEDYKNLGILEHGDTITVIFRIENTGSAPLKINTVQPFYRSSRAIWERQPIEPGKTGEIIIMFIPELCGGFTKTIEVTCNTLQKYYDLRLVGCVKEYSGKSINPKKTFVSSQN